MSNEDAFGIFVVVALILAGTNSCTCVVGNKHWEASAKKRGLMEYDQRTGVLEWKQEYKETGE